MKKLIAISSTILLLFPLYSWIITGYNFNNKDIYLKAEDVNINNHIDYLASNKFDIIRNPFIIKCKNIRDTILVLYTNVILINTANKTSVVTKSYWQIVLIEEKNGSKNRYIFSKSGEFFFDRKPKKITSIYLQEKKNIYFWLKQVNIDKLVNEKKLPKAQEPENSYMISFSYFLIPTK